MNQQIVYKCDACGSTFDFDKLYGISLYQHEGSTLPQPNTQYDLCSWCWHNILRSFELQGTKSGD